MSAPASAPTLPTSYAVRRPRAAALSVLRPSAEPEPSVSADVFRSVFRAHAGSVAVITADAGSGPVGFTATSVVSVSLTPPMFSFAIATGGSSFASMAETEWVGVHFLDAAQVDVARLFATPGVDRFAGPLPWSRSAEGVPVIDEVPSLIIGRIEHRLPVGDHQIVVARVVRADQRRRYRSLIYSDGQYHSQISGAATP